MKKEEESKRVADLKEQHTADLHALEERHEALRKRLGEQIDQLQERNGELELSLKAQLEDALNEAQALREQLSGSEEAKNKAQD